MTAPLVQASNLERVFNLGSERIRAIHSIDMEVASGQLMVISGRSGSGKTTLLNLLGGLDSPTSGAVYFQEQDLSGLSEWELTQLRRHRIGFIFQNGKHFFYGPFVLGGPGSHGGLILPD